MDELRVTYRGIEVPATMTHTTPNGIFYTWKAGVDAALDAKPQAKRNLRAELDRLLYDWGCGPETYEEIISSIESDAGRDGRDGVVRPTPKLDRLMSMTPPWDYTPVGPVTKARVFYRTEDIPADVKVLELSSSDSVVYRAENGGWLFDPTEHHTGWDLEKSDFPVTEVIE